MSSIALSHSSAGSILERLPYDIMQNIIDQLRTVDWGLSAQWLGDPFFPEAQRLESEDFTNMRVLRALSLTSKGLYELTKNTVYERICIRNPYQLYKLVQAVEQYEALVRSIERYTRRLDLTFAEKPVDDFGRYWTADCLLIFPNRMGSSLDASAERLLRRCRSLTHLTVSMFGEPVVPDNGHEIVKVIISSCPSLRVLHWRFGLEIMIEPLMQAYAVNLQVLDVSKVARLKQAGQLEIEMPFLRILKGPEHIIYRFVSVRLPSLHTVIVDYHFGMSNRPEDCVEFYRAHGSKLRSLTLLSPRLRFYDTDMRNLTKVAFNIATKYPFTYHTTPHHCLKQIGLLGADVDFPETTIRTLVDHKTVLNYLGTTCDTILNEQRNFFPELALVRLLEPQLLKHLEEDGLACQKLLDKFLIAGIRLEDNNGELVRPVIGPTPINL